VPNLCGPIRYVAPIRSVGSSSRTPYTPLTISTSHAADQRTTKALAIVASAKWIAKASFTTPRVLALRDSHETARR
jgi:hypothetical protein